MSYREWGELSPPTRWTLVIWSLIACPLIGLALTSFASSAGWINTEGAWPSAGIALGGPAALALVAAVFAGRVRGAPAFFLSLAAAAVAFLLVLVLLALAASSGAFS